MIIGPKRAGREPSLASPRTARTRRCLQPQAEQSQRALRHAVPGRAAAGNHRRRQTRRQSRSRVIVERLLSISGEDSRTIDRKFKAPWTGRLETRFLILSNELPRLTDPSGAMASRFITLVLTLSLLWQRRPRPRRQTCPRNARHPELEHRRLGTTEQAWLFRPPSILRSRSAGPRRPQQPNRCLHSPAMRSRRRPVR